MIQTLYACKIDKETRRYGIYWYALINGNVYVSGKTFTDLSMIDQKIDAISQDMRVVCESHSFADKHGSFAFIDENLNTCETYKKQAPGDIANLRDHLTAQRPDYKLFNDSEELKRYVVSVFAWEHFFDTVRSSCGQKQAAAEKDQPPLFYCKLPRDRIGSILTIGWQAVWNNNLYTRSYDLNLSVPFAVLLNQLRVILKGLPNCVASVFANAAYADAGSFNADLRANKHIDKSIIYSNSISGLLSCMLAHDDMPTMVKDAIQHLQNFTRFCWLEVVA